MDSKGNAERTSFPRGALRARIIATVLVAIALACTMLLFGAAQMHDDAFAAIYNVSSDESASAQDDSDGQNGASADKAAGEEIDDEENPMSSGLGGGEPVDSLGGIGLEWLIVAGIIAVVAFFGVSMGRQNSNINKMKRTIRFK